MDPDFLTRICMSLPGVTEDVKWDNDLVYSVANKMFCATSLEPPFKVSFKVTDEEFEDLTDRPGFEPAPYLARAKWIAVMDPAVLNQQEWIKYIEQSYQLIKAKLPRKTRVSLGLE